MLASRNSSTRFREPDPISGGIVDRISSSVEERRMIGTIGGFFFRECSADAFSDGFGYRRRESVPHLPVCSGFPPAEFPRVGEPLQTCCHPDGQTGHSIHGKVPVWR